MKKELLRILLLVVVLCTVLSTVSCSSCNMGETLLSLEKDDIEVTFSVNMYQLMLCRTKATLIELDSNAANEEFWDEWIGSPAKTMDDYYRDNILENCKTYVIALYLFEEKGLSLTEEEEAQIEQIMEDYVNADGNGSKSQLNSVLSNYGINYDILKEINTMQLKIQKLQEHLYGADGSKIGDDIKTAYMEENYIHYAHIFLPFSKYVYETDKNGDTIYYKTDATGAIDTTAIYYDVHNGTVSTDVDENGDNIYYSSNGKIAYDTAHGVKSIVINENGSLKTEALSEEELTTLEAEKDALMAELSGASYEKFAAVTARENEERDLGTEEYTDGYYIRRAEYAGDYAYLKDIITAYDALKDGEVGVVKSSYGYHIIQKVPFTDQAYDLEVNKASWFEDFNSLVAEKLFRDLCEPYYASVKVDEEVYKSAPSMKSVNPSYFY